MYGGRTARNQGSLEEKQVRETWMLEKALSPVARIADVTSISRISNLASAVPGSSPSVSLCPACGPSVSRDASPTAWVL